MTVTLLWMREAFWKQTSEAGTGNKRLLREMTGLLPSSQNAAARCEWWVPRPG
jgi:hypothetical protein